MNRSQYAVLCPLLLLSWSAHAQGSLAEASRDVLEGRQEVVRVQLNDAVAESLRRQLKTSSAVFAEVTALKTYRQPGCKRLRIVITAPAAVATDPATGKPHSFKFTQEMDTCADGSAPSAR